jgi:glucokinase
MRWAIGLDVGGTKIAGAMVAESGEIRDFATSPVPAKGDPAVEAVLQMSERMIARSRAQGIEPAGIGLAVPGAVDLAKGIVQRAPNLDWENLPLKDQGEARLGVPVEIELDVRAAALGAMLSDLARGISNFVYVTIGTGIGAGIVSDGQMQYGHHSCSGEIGHCVLVEDGPVCGCGQRGCLEALAAGPAIADRATRLIQKVPIATLLSSAIEADGKIDPQAVFETAQAGDCLALEVLRQTAEYIGRGLSLLINILNPQRIIIGGGIAKGGDCFIDLIRRYTAQYTSCRAPKQTEIVLSTDLDYLPVIGAAQLIFKRSMPAD